MPTEYEWFCDTLNTSRNLRRKDRQIDSLFFILTVVAHGRSYLVDCFVWLILLTNETLACLNCVKNDSSLIISQKDFVCVLSTRSVHLGRSITIYSCSFYFLRIVQLAQLTVFDFCDLFLVAAAVFHVWTYLTHAVTVFHLLSNFCMIMRWEASSGLAVLRVEEKLYT